MSETYSGALSTAKEINLNSFTFCVGETVKNEFLMLSGISFLSYNFAMSIFFSASASDRYSSLVNSRSISVLVVSIP